LLFIEKRVIISTTKYELQCAINTSLILIQEHGMSHLVQETRRKICINKNTKEVNVFKLCGPYDRPLILREVGSRAMAQLGTSWPLDAEAQVHAQSSHVGFVVDEVALG
jgi:hypothetical protein